MKSSSGQKGILARNTMINILGKAIPLAFAVVALPFIIKGLGTARFGVLTLIWIVIGYFGLFDMGIGRATTKFVADQEAKDEAGLSPIIVTSIVLLFILGLIAGGLIWIISPYLIHNILNVPSRLLAETQTALYVLSVSIPIVLCSIGARGILEARQRFTLINIVKIPATIINYVGPLLILPFSKKLQYIVLLLVIERTISLGIYLYFSLKAQPLQMPTDYSFLKWAKKLVGFGAWLTVSSIVSPVMVYMDRFIIGAVLTMSAVAYYTTPYEVITRLSIIAGGFMSVMFPAFSVFSLQNKQKMLELYQKSIRYLLFALLPVITFVVFGAQPLLHLWLGGAFARNSSAVLQILAIGILINSLARVPSTIIQAGGRPDIRAKLHLSEVPFYLAILWYFTITMGIKGVALAWLLRVSIDCGMLFYLSNHFIHYFNINWPPLLNKIGLAFAGILAETIIFWLIEGTFLMLCYALSCGLITLFLSWKYTLGAAERNRILHLITEASYKLKR